MSKRFGIRHLDVGAAVYDLTRVSEEGESRYYTYPGDAIVVHPEVSHGDVDSFLATAC